MLGLLFEPENEGDIFLRNIGSFSTDHMAYSRRQNKDAFDAPGSKALYMQIILS
jgi:hypothetical protein